MTSAIVFQGISLVIFLLIYLASFSLCLFLFHVVALDHGVLESLAIPVSLRDLTLALITSLRG